MNEFAANSDALSQRRPLFARHLPPDPFLVAVAAKLDSHRFLANCTQAIYRRQAEFLARLLGQHTGRPASEVDVLDWGCGTGQSTYLLRQLGLRVTSCDIERTNSDSAFGQSTPILEHIGAHVVPLGDPIRLPFADRSFDCVASFGVLEHVSSDAGSLREIRRVLRTGGLCYVTFLPYFLSWTQALARLSGDHYHDRLYSRRQIRSLAQAAGFATGAIDLAQLFPKTVVPYGWDRVLEPIDRALCRFTPLKFFATNLELVLLAV